MYIHESQHLSPIKNHQTPTYQPPLPTQNTGFPILAVAVLCVMATAFLLVSYYIFVTKCCINWQQISPLRRFSITRVRITEDPLMAYSPSWQSRGLDETLIREIPTFQFSKSRREETSLNKCVVCLNEFQEQETLRLLPNCKHAFHLDCIDIWLQNNANCPLCRLSISGATRYPMDRIIAPTSSPQDPQPFISNSHMGSNEDFVVIELGEEGNESREHVVLQSRRHSSSPRKFEQKSWETRKSHPISSRGDECINVRENEDQFSIEPIRRSFSMDSAVDQHIYSSVQEIIRQNGIQIATRNNEECSSRVRRPFFSFGNGRGSRSAVLPVEL